MRIQLYICVCAFGLLLVGGGCSDADPGTGPVMVFPDDRDVGRSIEQFDQGLTDYDSATQLDDAALSLADRGVQPDGQMQPSPSPNPDASVPDLDPDPMINTGWIGGPCQLDSDCDYADSFCLTDDDGYPRGLCSLDCDRFCPDQDGMPVTFCIGDVVAGGGACVQRCDYDAFGRTGCRPGYRCETRRRYNEASVGRGVCVPGEDERPTNPMMGECFDRLTALGVNYDQLAPISDIVDGAPHLMCVVNENVRVHSPINGISFHYDDRDAGSVTMSCDLAVAVHSLTQLLAEYDIVQVGHIGTYSCRGIRSDDGTINQLSQHGLSRAIDLLWFRNSAGREFNVYDHWEHGVTRNFRTQEGEFLYEVGLEMWRRRIFNIVLTPEFNAAHDNHFHCDLTQGANFIGHNGDVAGCGNH